jgi:hypothetical protein
MSISDSTIPREEEIQSVEIGSSINYAFADKVQRIGEQDYRATAEV